MANRKRLHATACILQRLVQMERLKYQMLSMIRCLADVATCEEERNCAAFACVFNSLCAATSGACGFTDSFTVQLLY